MKTVSKFACVTLVMASLAGCGWDNQDVGVLTGGAVGGLLGSQFGGGSGKIFAAVGGSLLGAVIGGSIGKSMDRTDRMYFNRTLENGHNNRIQSWHNPDNGNTYHVKPTRTYYKNDQPCRDFTTTAIIGGKTETIYGKACRKADGTWKVIQ